MQSKKIKNVFFLFFFCLSIVATAVRIEARAVEKFHLRQSKHPSKHQGQMYSALYQGSDSQNSKVSDLTPRKMKKNQIKLNLEMRMALKAKKANSSLESNCCEDTCEDYYDTCEEDGCETYCEEDSCEDDWCDEDDGSCDACEQDACDDYCDEDDCADDTCEEYDDSCETCEDDRSSK